HAIAAAFALTFTRKPHLASSTCAFYDVTRLRICSYPSHNRYPISAIPNERASFKNAGVSTTVCKSHYTPMEYSDYQVRCGTRFPPRALQVLAFDPSSSVSFESLRRVTSSTLELPSP